MVSIKSLVKPADEDVVKAVGMTSDKGVEHRFSKAIVYGECISL